MNSAGKVALTKLVTKTQSSDLAVFSVIETDTKSTETALDDAKTLIGKRKGDYAVVVVRKT